MLLSQHQKLANDLMATLTPKHYNKEVFFVLPGDVRLALFFYHISSITDEKFAAKIPNCWCSLAFVEGEKPQRNQQTKLMVSTCDRNSYMKFRMEPEACMSRER